jgi:hypothetical protein
MGVMTDALKVTPPLPVPPAVSQPRAYADAREVRALASVTENAESPATKRVLGRLGRVLASSEPPRADLPRGFYVNIQV